MPSIILTIGYITEANRITSTSTIITKGVIACNRPEQNGPLFINFIACNVIDHYLVYLFHRKFVYNKSIGENYELQVNKYF